VTLVEALAELQVDAAADAEQVRRAYLRQLKTKKPEVDPDGFRRLREAYDFARSRLQPRRVLAGTGEIAVTMPTASLPPVAPPTESEAHAPQAPDEPSPPQRLPVSPGPSAATALEADARTSLNDVRRLLAEGNPVAAAHRLAEVYSAAAVRIEHPTPPPGVTLDLLLHLHEIAQVEAANALMLRFREWLKATGDEVRVLPGLLAARWVICRDLGALPPPVSWPVRTLLARAARTGDMAEARRVANELRWRNPQAAAADAALLRARGGVLGDQVADFLAPPVRPVASSRSRMGPWFLIFPALMVLRALGSAFIDDHETDRGATYGAYSAPVPVTRPRGPVASAAGAARQLSRDAEAAQREELAHRAQELAGALLAENCGLANVYASDLLNLPLDDSGLRSEIDDVARRVLAACGGAPAAGASSSGAGSIP
jgi:hypothetical protein